MAEKSLGGAPFSIFHLPSSTFVEALLVMPMERVLLMNNQEGDNLIAR
jgi:hypothetical protein